MKHTWLISCLLVVLFFCTQITGLLITNSYISSIEDGKASWKELPSIGGLKFERPDVEPQVSIWYIVGAVIVGTLLILLIIRFGKVLLWKVWFLFAVFMCLYIAFAAFIPAFYALIIALLIAIVKVFRPNLIVHNLSELFLYGGLAAIFVPILNVLYAFILLILLSAYDMYAVWKSKHMVSMAKFQTKSGIFAGLSIPYALPKKGGKKMKVRTAVLGGGDMGFPLIFAGSVLVASGFLSALFVVFGATASLFVLLLLSQKDKFYPAMPFLTVGCVVGWLFTLLL